MSLRHHSTSRQVLRFLFLSSDSILVFAYCTCTTQPSTEAASLRLRQFCGCRSSLVNVRLRISQSPLRPPPPTHLSYKLITLRARYAGLLAVCAASSSMPRCSLMVLAGRPAHSNTAQAVCKGQLPTQQVRHTHVLTLALGDPGTPNCISMDKGRPRLLPALVAASCLS